MSNPWSINVHGLSNADAIRRVCHSKAPQFAIDHLVGVLRGEKGYYTRSFNPDGPITVWGSGEDHGDYIGIACARIVYDA